MQPLKNCIGPTNLIGREILCLPYAGSFYYKPEASYITYPSYTELSYTALFWNSFYMVYSPWTGGSG